MPTKGSIVAKAPCIHCNKETEMEIPEEALPKSTTVQVLKREEPQLQDLDALIDKKLKDREPKEPPKPKTDDDMKVPDYLPFVHCKNGNCDQPGHLHKNKKASKQLRRKCERCDQIGPQGAKGCTTCGKVFEDESDYEDLDDEDLKDRHIPIIEAPEHDHEHDE